MLVMCVYNLNRTFEGTLRKILLHKKNAARTLLAYVYDSWKVETMMYMAWRHFIKYGLYTENREMQANKYQTMYVYYIYQIHIV